MIKILPTKDIWMNNHFSKSGKNLTTLNPFFAFCSMNDKPQIENTTKLDYKNNTQIYKNHYR